MYLSSLLWVAATGIGNVVDLFAARRDDDGADRSAYGIFELDVGKRGSVCYMAIRSLGRLLLIVGTWACPPN